MKPQSAKAKGKKMEDLIAKKILLSGTCSHATRNKDSGAGHESKSDIITDLKVAGNPACIECKHQKRFNIGDWWRQVRESASVNDETPLLVFKLPNTSTDLVCLDFDVFLELLQRQGEKQPELDKKIEKLLEAEQQKKERLAKMREFRNRSKRGKTAIEY